MKKNLYLKINRLREKLNESINKTGLNSKETRKLSIEIDKLISEYYRINPQKEYPKDSKIFKDYSLSYKALKNWFIDTKTFPTIKEWNAYAKKYGFLSHLSLEYITGHKWEKLERFIRLEAKFKIF